MFAITSTNSCTYLITLEGDIYIVTSLVFTNNTPPVLPTILCHVYSYVVLICLLPYALLYMTCTLY